MYRVMIWPSNLMSYFLFLFFEGCHLHIKFVCSKRLEYHPDFGAAIVDTKSLHFTLLIILNKLQKLILIWDLQDLFSFLGKSWSMAFLLFIDFIFANKLSPLWLDLRLGSSCRGPLGWHSRKRIEIVKFC